METLNFRKIEAFSREALEIADEYGVDEALNFLIIEKFTPYYLEFQKTKEKLKYLYGPEDAETVQALKLRDPALKLSLGESYQKDYQSLVSDIDEKRRLCQEFIQEIKEVFSEEDIIGYLNPNLRTEHHDEDSLFSSDLSMNGDDLGSGMTSEDLFDEIKDIFLIEELKKIFQGKLLSR